MKYTLLRFFFVSALLIAIGTVPAFGQSFTRSMPAPADGRIAPGVAGMPAPAVSPSAVIDTSLSYYSFDGLPFRIPIGTYPPGGADSKAVGIFFDAPFDATIDEVHFAIYETSDDPGIEGTGTLRLKVTEVPMTAGVDSLDLDFSELEVDGFPQAGNLSNQVDLTSRNFELRGGRQYFFEFVLVDESPNASLDFVFDAGSDDPDDTDHYPARSFVLVVEGEDEQYVRLVDPENENFQNLNLFVEFKLSRAPTAQLQVLHNAPAASVLDVYVNDTRVANNLTFQEASAFMEAPAGEGTLAVVSGTDPNNSNPLFTTEVNLTADAPYLAMLYGIAGENFGVGVQGLTEESSERGQINIVVAHGGVGAGPLDVNILDDTGGQVVAEALALGDITMPVVVDTEPPLNLEVAMADGTLLDVFRIDAPGGGGDDISKTRTVLAVTGRGTASQPFSLIQIEDDGTVTAPAVVTDTEEPDAGVPARFALRGNYPNPFNPVTTIAFDLAAPGFTTLKVYNLLGQEVATLVEGMLPASTHQMTFDATTLPSGTYVYRLASGDHTQQRLLMLVK
jgi:hypothetical protein